METAVPRPCTDANECWAGGAASGWDGCGHGCCGGCWGGCGDDCCQGGCEGCWGRGASSRGCRSTAPPPPRSGHIVDQSGRPRRGKGTSYDRPSAQTLGTILTLASCTAPSRSASISGYWYGMPRMV